MQTEKESKYKRVVDNSDFNINKTAGFSEKHAIDDKILPSSAHLLMTITSALEGY